MKLPPYPEYKPSGVEWLGDVPQHWTVKRSDTSVTTAKQQIAPEIFAGAEVMHYSIPVVQEIGTGAVENGEDIASAKQLIDAPVVLVSRLNPRKATICRATPHGELLTLASTEFVALQPTSGDIRFLEYLVSSELFRQRLDSWVQSVTRSHQRARPDEIYRFWNAWPEKNEQSTIADFLDRETAKIDTLVAKKRTLIERLKEKRGALISRTVTRGLPPDAARAAGLDPHPKLKPSGIDWLGDVPEHWAVERLRRVCKRVTDGAHISPDLSSPDYPFVSTVDVSNGTIDVVDCLWTSNECFEYLAHTGCQPRPGDVLFSKDGTIGRTAIVRTEIDFVVASSLVIISPESTRLESRFLDYWLNNSLLQQNILLQLAGAALRRISVEKVGRLVVVLPGLDEQCEIADFLDRETGKLDAMIAKVETAIERLQEYRTALITAAVTGKIDVRGAAA